RAVDHQRGQGVPVGPARRDGERALTDVGATATPSGASRHLPQQVGESALPSAPPTQEELVLVLDFGAQYSQLIARRVREAGVYCELVPGTTPWSELEARRPAGLILSGGPASVYEAGAPQVDPAALRSGVPVLGICYGMQLIAHPP